MAVRSMTVHRYEEIRRRLAEGRGLREIARALGCSRRTVREVRDGERVSPQSGAEEVRVLAAPHHEPCRQRHPDTEQPPCIPDQVDHPQCLRAGGDHLPHDQAGLEAFTCRDVARIFVAMAPTNMHLSFDPLVALPRDVLTQGPLVRLARACH